jgi:methylenetetrahydrofolate dehydrogenase (NADP+)/methenyltetrahydrofolate cyclohydrolase
MAELIKGSLVASHIRQQVRRDATALRERGVVPCLAVCLVGSDPASRIYIRNKQRAAEGAGIENIRVDLPESAKTRDVLEVVERWNADCDVHGILVQLPLPEHIDREAVIDAIDPSKDVDGIHAANIGYLTQGRPRVLPCTPAGIIELFKHYHISTAGKHVVIVNRGIVVGLPLVPMLTHEGRYGNATVTVCHEHTQHIERVCRSADIIIVAVGKRPDFVLRGDMVKKGAVVIDVGINRVGKRTVGDAEFDEVYEKAAMITPVPGGVGPCTIAMLLRNTVDAARRAADREGSLSATAEGRLARSVLSPGD